MTLKQIWEIFKNWNLVLYKKPNRSIARLFKREKKRSGHKLLTNTMPGPDDFTSEVYQSLKKTDSILPQNSVDLSSWEQYNLDFQTRQEQYKKGKL